jgi:hypothetical protein
MPLLLKTKIPTKFWKKEKREKSRWALARWAVIYNSR